MSFGARLLQIVTGKPVFRSATTEAAALGLVFWRLARSGLHADARQAARAMARLLPRAFEPDPSRHAFYTHLFEEVYRPLFPALQPYLDRLTRLSGAQESGGT